MLKRRIEKLEDVEEKYRDLYTEKDGFYYLEAEGGEDVDGLRRTNQTLKTEKKAMKTELETLRTQMEELQEQIEEKSSEKLSTEEKLTKKFEKQLADLQSKLEKAEARHQSTVEQLQSSTRDDIVTKLAAELAGEDAMLLSPHLKNRVAVSLTDEGKVSSSFVSVDGDEMTKESLLTEFRANKAFEKILVGRDSTGGGSGGNHTSGDAATGVEKFFDPSNDAYSLTKQAEVAAKTPKIAEQLTTKYKLTDVYSQAKANL